MVPRLTLKPQVLVVLAAEALVEAAQVLRVVLQQVTKVMPVAQWPVLLALKMVRVVVVRDKQEQMETVALVVMEWHQPLLALQ